jgi:hypothetical protein|tara:strand:+ start:1243 stop:1656 length:414 start_codon:yes stop_codon:yes gene_type:complete
MKKLLLLLAAFGFFTSSWAQTQVKILTVVESIVPMGIGRSRIIESVDTVSSTFLSNINTARDEMRIEKFNEIKLLNLYSGVGINFQNIASNDAIVTAKLISLLGEGWKISFVLGGVESNAGKDDGQGIFVTRYILTK